MTGDLPIYPDAKLRTGLQFTDVDKFRFVDSTSIWEKSDTFIEKMEGASGLARARSGVAELSRQSLLQVHSMIFSGRSGAGELRKTASRPLYRGHDCPEPEFIERSLENFFGWLSAESLKQIHPIERAAVILARIVDIWPFEFGNVTAAIVAANISLGQDGFSPFFVLPEHKKEFDAALGLAMTVETQPLVNAIHRTIKREMEALAQ
jgi:hypothetical protein